MIHKKRQSMIITILLFTINANAMSVRTPRPNHDTDEIKISGYRTIEEMSIIKTIYTAYSLKTPYSSLTYELTKETNKKTGASTFFGTKLSGTRDSKTLVQLARRDAERLYLQAALIHTKEQAAKTDNRP